MAFRNPAAALVQVGLAPGRQVVIDPNAAAAGQITFPNPNGFTPASLGTTTSPGFEALRLTGPIQPTGNPDQVYIEESDFGVGNPRIVLAANAPSLTVFTGVVIDFDGVQINRTVGGVAKGGSVPAFIDTLSGPPQVYMQRGVVNQATDAASKITFNYTTPFPTACDALVVGPPVNGSTGFFVMVLFARGAASFQYEFHTLAGALVGAGFQAVFDFVAVGH